MSNKKRLLLLQSVLITVMLIGTSIFTQVFSAYAVPFNNIATSSPAGHIQPTYPQSNSVLASLGDRWWNFAFSIDTSNPQVKNPFTDTTGASCGIGLQPDNLLFLFGTAGEITTSSGTGGHTGDVRTCSTPIPRGTSILLPVLNTECSIAEGSVFPRQPLTETSLRDFCTAITNHATSLTAIVDGRQILSSNGAIQQSHAMSAPGGFQLTIVPNNPFGVTKVITNPNQPARPFHQPITTLSVADGFWVLLSNLPPGPHTIEFGGVYDFLNNPDPNFPSFIFKTGVTYNVIAQ